MYINFMQVRNSEVLIYDYWMGIRKAAHDRGTNPFAPGGAYSGTMTNSGAKRLRKATSLLIQKSPKRWIMNPVTGNKHQFRLNFITLTIADSQQSTAKEIYKNCLAPWLRWARTTGIKDYIWKAELQQRGEVHYHVVTNQFLHWEDIRDVWNKYQKKAGYLDAYAKKHKHFKPNSTDVHVMRRIKDIESYLTKYLLKGVGNGGTAGKVWDCSKNLKDATYFTTELTPDNLDRLRRICTKEIPTEHCTIFRIPQDSAPAVLDRVQQLEYQLHLRAI